MAPGWAANSVNVVVFRKHSLVTDGATQYTAFYDPEGRVVLGSRKLGSTDWRLVTTRYSGNVRDAHNTISFGIDGAGYLHVAWDHHNNPLRYCRSVGPGSLELGEKTLMVGSDEERVTYPEFHRLPDGDLLFLCRDGASGNGNLVVNRYRVETGKWERVQSNLIDGQGERNAYWQACVDAQGRLHVSWVWRESPDVASNHDLCYAASPDGGRTWFKSSGQSYELPITAANAEIAASIPQNHELINQTSMTTDSSGHPRIATYWRPEGVEVPQFHVVYHDGAGWRLSQASNRKTPFRLAGGGTKRIPISRPQLLSRKTEGVERLYLVFRDEERGSKASIAISDDFREGRWHTVDLNESSLGMWEPTCDHALWQRDGRLHLFVQEAEQVDAEGVSAAVARMVYVLEWAPTD